MRCYPQKYVIGTQPVIEPIGESRSDTDIIFGLAQKLGLDYQKYDGATGRCDGRPRVGFLPNGAPDFGARFRRSHGLDPRAQWHDNGRAQAAPRRHAGTESPSGAFKKYEKNGFPTPSGKMEFSSSIAREALGPRGHRRPSALQRAQAQPGLDARRGRRLPAGPRHRHAAAHVHPLADVPAPLDSQSSPGRRGRPQPGRRGRYGIADGDTVELSTPQASIVVKANVTELARPGVAHMYHDYPEADVNTPSPRRLSGSHLGLPRVQSFALRGEEGWRPRHPKRRG